MNSIVLQQDLSLATGNLSHPLLIHTDFALRGHSMRKMRENFSKNHDIRCTEVKKKAVKFLSTGGVFLVPRYLHYGSCMAEQKLNVIKIDLKTSSNKDDTGNCR